MRFRKLKNLDTRRDNCSELRIPYSIPDFDLRNIDNVRAYIDFSEYFENDAPLVLEIGCGKGQFATEYAKRNPDKNVVGIECVPGVLVIACEKAKEAEVENLRFLEMSGISSRIHQGKEHFGNFPQLQHTLPESKARKAQTYKPRIFKHL